MKSNVLWEELIPNPFQAIKKWRESTLKNSRGGLGWEVHDLHERRGRPQETGGGPPRRKKRHLQGTAIKR